MSAVAHNAAQRAGQRQHDNASPPESDDSSRDDELRAAIKGDGEFIAEAVGNGNLADLADAYRLRSPQEMFDALDDVVDGYLCECVRFQLQRRDYFSSDYPRTDLDALENIARVWGVS